MGLWNTLATWWGMGNTLANLEEVGEYPCPPGVLSFCFRSLQFRKTVLDLAEPVGCDLEEEREAVSGSPHNISHCHRAHHHPKNTITLSYQGHHHTKYTITPSTPSHWAHRHQTHYHPKHTICGQTHTPLRACGDLCCNIFCFFSSEESG